LRSINFFKANPSVSVVGFRVRARSVKHAFNRVRGASDVCAAFDGCERGRKQHEQEPDYPNDDEQFEQRKSAGALTLLFSGVTRTDCVPKGMGDHNGKNVKALARSRCFFRV
jgi:hypothetical protein